MDRTVTALPAGLVLLLAGFLALAAALLVAAPAALASPAYAPEQALATGPAAQSSPQIGTGCSAWEDDAAGDWDVFVGWPLTQVVLPLGTSDQRHPDASRFVVVYEDDRNGTWDLYAWQIAPWPAAAGQGEESPVVTGAGDQLDPAVDGDLVAYEDTRLGDLNIALHDLNTGATSFLVRNTAAQIDPSIDGNWVAWADRRNGNWDIYAFDLKRSKLRQLTTNRADQKAPQVGQSRVVYQDRRNGNWDIYEYILASGKERRLTSGKTDQTAPRIDPDRAWSGHPGNVVYVDDRGDGGDIFLRDGATGIVKPVCAEPGAQTSPDISHERIVWCDARDGSADVYATALDYPSLSASVRDTAPAFDSLVTVMGRLNGTDPGGQTIRVSDNGPVRTSSTEAEGYYSVSAGRVQRKVTLRVWYAGDAAHLPAVASSIVVKPMASLSRPKAVQKSFCTEPSRLAPPIKWAVSGSLRPLHQAGSRAVTLAIFTRSNNLAEWKLYRTQRVRVRNAGSASSYATTISLPGYYYALWRIQAVHADAGHTKTRSAFSQSFSPSPQ